jgi:hypothetical protein
VLLLVIFCDIPTRSRKIKKLKKEEKNILDVVLIKKNKKKLHRIVTPTKNNNYFGCKLIMLHK